MSDGALNQLSLINDGFPHNNKLKLCLSQLPNGGGIVFDLSFNLTSMSFPDFLPQILNNFRDLFKPIWHW